MWDRCADLELIRGLVTDRFRQSLVHFTHSLLPSGLSLCRVPRGREGPGRLGTATAGGIPSQPCLGAQLEVRWGAGVAWGGGEPPGRADEWTPLPLPEPAAMQGQETQGGSDADGLI